MKDLYLGIDTSNYTTSIALIDGEEKVVFEKRKILKVKKGQRGLRQSEAVFQHIQNISLLMEEMDKDLYYGNIRAVCASTKPRPLKESYMPVFEVSKTMGQAIARFLEIPFYETSHQEGHIMAGIWSGAGPNKNAFISVHLSGGTTEIITTHRNREGFRERIVGGSRDLNAGQFIDRVGVAMGLEFPSGPALEKLAAKGEKGVVIIPSWVKDGQISFSGPETMAQRLIDKKLKKPDIALAVQHCIAKSLEKSLINVIEQEKIYHVLLVGGVASNQYIKNHLINRLGPKGIHLYFSAREYASDNSVGVALIGKRKHHNIRGEKK